MAALWGCQGLLGPAISQPGHPVEDRFFGGMVLAVGNEITMALKLKLVVCCGMGKGRLQVGLDYAQAVRVQAGQKILLASVWLRVGKQAVVQANFGAVSRLPSGRVEYEHV